VQEYKYSYSLVIPVYNSSNSLAKLVDEIKFALEGESYQVIFINDSSLDNSWQVLMELKAESKAEMVLVSLAHNSGQHAALYCGLMYAEGKYIVTLDDDLQHKPAEILKLKKCLQEENADLVYGIYEQKKHGIVRNTGSRLFAAVVNKFASTPLKGSSFKLIHASVIEKVLQHQHFNFYLDEVLAWHSKKTSFAIVEHQKRIMGSSGYSPILLVKMSIRILLTYTALPLKFITYLGFLSSLFSFGFGIFYIYEKLINESQSGFTAIIVSIFFSTGLILFSLGIIGEYISRIFLIQSGKPPFKIKDVER
jgi:undecaprenyl-phosphate 4-deoxy-4-formamido-L-arabinose transferase